MAWFNSFAFARSATPRPCWSSDMPVSISSVPCVVPSGPCRSPAAGIFMEPAGCPSSAADEQPRLLGAELHQFACAYGGMPRPAWAGRRRRRQERSRCSQGRVLALPTPLVHSVPTKNLPSPHFTPPPRSRFVGQWFSGTWQVRRAADRCCIRAVESNRSTLGCCDFFSAQSAS